MLSTRAVANVYTDFKGLEELKRQARNDSSQALTPVAKQFEALFVQMMLKSMRDAGSAGSLFDNDQTRFYQELHDKQLSLRLADHTGIGLAKLLTEQLGDGSKAAQNETGKGLDSYRHNPVLRSYGGLREEEMSPQEAVNPGEKTKELTVMATRASPNHESRSRHDRWFPDYPARNPSDELRSTKTVPDGFVPHPGPLFPGNPARNPSGAPGATKSAPGGFVPEGEGEQGVGYATFMLKNSPGRPIHSKEKFVERILPFARQAAEELGVAPGVLIAQAALETGWGRSMLQRANGENSHNLFNIKAGDRWKGERAAITTLEFENGVMEKRGASFRVYRDFEQSFRDYVDLVKKSPRYENALKNVQSPRFYIEALQNAGYATDPHYADKVMRIFGQIELAAADADNGARPEA